MSVLKEKMQKSSNDDSNVLEEKQEDFDKMFEDKNLVKIKENEGDKTQNKKEDAKKKTSKVHNKKDEAIKSKSEEPSNQNFMISKENFDMEHSKTRKVLLCTGISVFSIIIILLSVILCCNIFYKKIFSNVIVSGIDISNLSKDEAIEKINSELETKLDDEILLKCDDKEYTFLPSDIGVKYDVEGAVDESYRIGRTGNIIENNIDMVKSLFVDTVSDLKFDYDEEKFNELVNKINEQFSSLVESSYEIQEDKIIMRKGIAGTEIKSDVLKEKIIDSIEKVNFEPIQVGVIVKQPTDLNIDSIYNEVYKAPVDAYYTKDPFEVHESENGVDFAISIDEAKALLETEQEEYEIPLKVLYPTVTTSQIGTEAFPDLLATCTTTYITSKVGRTNNLKVASSKIDGYVLMPGDTFSYNNVVGERTVEAGFQVAGVYSGGKEVEGLGGGICQISSTLYNIVVKSNLEVVQRENHVFLPGYLPAGQDATVVYGSIDFKFKNTRNYPVKIVSSVSGGYVTMKMFGMKEENEPEISFETVYHETLYPKTVYEDTTSLPAGQTKIQSSGKNGCKSTTYKVVKQNGQVVSKTVLSNDTYQAMNNYVLRGVKKQEVAQQPAKQETPATNPSTETKPSTEEKPSTETKPTTNTVTTGASQTTGTKPTNETKTTE